mgnify:FL=1
MNVQRRIRWYQRPFHEYLVNTPGARAIEIAHRRWGKDEIVLAATCELAHRRVASYWHCMPEYEQARKALWNGVNAHTGRRRIDEAFPPDLRESKDEQQMLIKFRNGSTWQLIGSDRYDATVGAGVAGIAYSEWALANPSAWAYHRPMLEENNGWAAFITTPRGNNHAKAMLDHARAHPERWFAEVSSVLDTGALTADQLAESLAEYQALYGDDLGRAQFEQEYLCSFNAAILGAYWGAEMAAADREGRMQAVAIHPDYPVHTAWDLGKAVNNPIWCFQVIPGEPGPRIVDFYRPDTDDLEQWCLWLSERGYVGNDYVPHDILTEEWGTGRNRFETLRLLKRKPTRVAKVSVAEGINAGRQTIKLARFHAGDDERGERCELGCDGLKNYRREWDDELKTFRDHPVKDWAEHIGSSFRYLSLGWRMAKAEPPPVKKPSALEYVAKPDGTVMGNLSVKDAVAAMVKRRASGR